MTRETEDQRVLPRQGVRAIAAASAAACLFAALCIANADLLGLASLLAFAAAGACAWIALRPEAETSQGAPPPAPVVRLAVSDNSEGAVAAVLEGLHEPALLIDSDSRIVAVNGAARRLLSAPTVGARLSSVLRAPALLDAAEAATQARRGAEVEYEPLGGVEQHFKVAIAPVSLAAGAALMVFYDQTAMISAERMRVEFLANASHELRTPLASLTLLIETLAGHAKDDLEAQKRFLALMQTQAERMKRLIDDLLSLSKIELNEHVPPAEQVDLVHLAREIADTLSPLAAEREVTLALEFESPGAVVVGDRFQLVQVVQNLVDNAIKYSPRGGKVEVQVGLAADRDQASHRASRRWSEASRFSLLSPPPSAGRYAYMRVADSGPGIARRHLPRLSERFFRVEREETADHSGTGLGLAIVKHIVNRHRGGLTVESEPGRGSAFAIYIEQPYGEREPA